MNKQTEVRKVAGSATYKHSEQPKKIFLFWLKSLSQTTYCTFNMKKLSHWKASLKTCVLNFIDIGAIL